METNHSPTPTHTPDSGRPAGKAGNGLGRPRAGEGHHDPGQGTPAVRCESKLNIVVDGLQTRDSGRHA